MINYGTSVEKITKTVTKKRGKFHNIRSIKSTMKYKSKFVELTQNINTKRIKKTPKNGKLEVISGFRA